MSDCLSYIRGVPGGGGVGIPGGGGGAEAKIFLGASAALIQPLRLIT